VDDDIAFDDRATHPESLKTLNELFLIADRFTTRLASNA
jgi:hypothetical protein